jgi:hypothetical protein
MTLFYADVPIVLLVSYLFSEFLPLFLSLSAILEDYLLSIGLNLYDI